MKLVCTKKNFKVFYSEHKNEYVVYNMHKIWEEGHTHISKYEQAMYLVDCSIHKKIPKRTNRYFLVSLLRLSKDIKYTYRIQRILDGEEPKKGYRNVPKNFRK